ncbi:MAG: RHS repeat-associated core domain-containing protein, partial [Acidimicrobiia bacterium]
MQGQQIARRYTYDQVGNRLTNAIEVSGVEASRVDYTYDAAHELTTAARKVGGLTTETAAFTHDPAGRLTQSSDGYSRRITYGYNAAGQLAVVDDDPVTAVYGETTRAYDGDGRLLRFDFAVAGGGHPRFTWDPTSGTPQVVSLDNTAGNTILVNGENRAVATRGTQSQVFAYDAYGSAVTTNTTDPLDLVRSSSYDAFGIPVGETTDIPLIAEVAGFADVATSDRLPQFGYRGELHADGMLHLRARDYASGVGAFTTQDPLQAMPGEVTVGNPYPYAANDPINKIDPLGLSPVQDRDLRAPLTRPVLLWQEGHQSEDSFFLSVVQAVYEGR